MKVPTWIYVAAGIVVIGLVFVIQTLDNYKLTGALSDKKVGKQLTIIISEDTVVDSEYITKVMNGEIETNTPNFDLLDKSECEKLISYMEDNKLVIVAGKYEINQGWRFEKIIEVLKFAN